MQRTVIFPDPNLKYICIRCFYPDKIPPGRSLSRQFEITAENIRFHFIILYPSRKYLGLLFSRDGTTANSLVARECPWEKWQRETTLLTFFRYNTAGITRRAFRGFKFLGIACKKKEERSPRQYLLFS